MKKYLLTFIVFCAILFPSIVFASCICEDGTVGYTKAELQTQKSDLAIVLYNTKAMNLLAEQELQSKIVAVDVKVQEILDYEVLQQSILLESQETPIK